MHNCYCMVMKLPVLHNAQHFPYPVLLEEYSIVNFTIISPPSLHPPNELTLYLGQYQFVLLLLQHIHFI